ncbi:11828_t:CDS:2, partial [Acaulospora colombiana]
MTVSTNRYSALLQESTGHESTPTLVGLSTSKSPGPQAVASVVTQNQSVLFNGTKFPPGSRAPSLPTGLTWENFFIIHYLQAAPLSRTFLHSNGERSFAAVYLGEHANACGEGASTYTLLPLSLPHVAPPQDLQDKLLKLISESIDPVSVKIINDKFGHKAAFVQAKSQEDADILLKATLRLEGRLLRLERARAHRALALSFTRPSGIVSKIRIIRGTDKYVQTHTK